MNTGPDWTPENPHYRTFYGWDDKAAAWQLEYTISRSGDKIAMHLFSSRKDTPVQGTLFILHGYLEHSALRIPLVLEAVKAGWNVCAMDLPGHGLSSGARADIDNFDEYALALRAVFKSRSWIKPWRLAAHSTGCAATLLYVQKYQNPFEWVLFEAPLVRTFLWDPFMTAKRFLRGALSTLPRRNSGLPKSQRFYKLLFRDPHYQGRVPLSWFDALERYEYCTKAWKPVHGYFLILQGKNDTAVDAEYNLHFLRQLLPGAELAIIKNGRHHLLRDEGPAGIEARAVVRAAW